ncbi:MAG: hypothetical protein HKN47_06615, partial [Pirellulaceae bacterium]|nr:hypothetical protein [Pirellulaceae bacterium]
MSYLDPPRFSFLGRFRANVPTRNNDLTNYDPAKKITVVTPGDWNSFGSGGFEIFGGRVTSGMNEAGELATKNSEDKLIGAAVSSRPHGADVIPREFGDAKIVDLDPSQRRLSTIFGLEVTIDLSTADDQLLLNGTMKPTCFRDYWNQRSAKGSGTSSAALMPASTGFQSVLSNVTWNGSYDMSPLLMQLHDVSQENDGQLSIKFNVDQFLLSQDPETNLTGRLIGTIGPYFADEPDHFVAQRRLVWTATAKTQEFFATPFQLDEKRKKLVFDFGNSVQLDTPDGSPLNSEVFPAILPIEGSAKLARPLVDKVPLKTTTEQLELTAGIVEADVADVEL